MIDSKNAAQNTPTRLLTLGEAADFLRLHPRTLEVWARGPSPRVPVIRLGRRVLFDRGALEEWLRSLTVRPRDGVSR